MGFRRAAHMRRWILVTCLGCLVISWASMAHAKPGKSDICHKAGTERQKTLSVSDNDVPDHLGHGDTLGACSPLQETNEYTCIGSADEYLRLYVRSTAFGTMNGTVERPFNSVGAALAYAERKELAAVELQIAPGSYPPEAINISTNTRLVGDGDTTSLTLAASVYGPHTLAVQGLRISAVENNPGMTIANPDARTYLCNSQITGATGHGVSQSGGELIASRLTIQSTQLDPSQSPSAFNGTAIVLRDGVQAILNNLTVGIWPVDEQQFSNGNAGSGLVADGIGTTVSLDRELIPLSQSNFVANQGCAGAIVVSNGAQLYSGVIQVLHNAQLGINATGSGSLADLIAPLVEQTSSNDECDSSAVNVRAADGAEVFITGFGFLRFRIAHSNVGIQVRGGSSANLAFGVVDGHDVAANIDDASVDSLTDNQVEYLNNIVMLDGLTLPVPKASLEWACENGLDDDDDGRVDFCDPDCAFPPVCP